MVIEILDIHGNPTYEISATKCSFGFCFEPLCATCKPINFDIKDMRRDGAVISKIVKHSMGCGIECSNNAGKNITKTELICL